MQIKDDTINYNNLNHVEFLITCPSLASSAELLETEN